MKTEKTDKINGRNIRDRNIDDRSTCDRVIPTSSFFCHQFFCPFFLSFRASLFDGMASARDARIRGLTPPARPRSSAQPFDEVVAHKGIVIEVRIGPTDAVD